MQTTITCEICKAIKQKLLEPIDLVDKNIGFIKETLCPIVSIASQSMSVKDCKNIVDFYEPYVFMNLMRLLVGREDLICGIAVKVCESPDLKVFDLKGWIKNALKGTPISSTKKEPTGKKGTYTIMQVNDIHFDKFYYEGGEAVCHNNIICCRKDSKTPIGEKKTPAGRFGMAHSCDVPERTIDDFFAFLSDKIKPDVLMWLGDNEFHEIDMISADYNIEASSKLAQKFQSYLSGKNTDMWLSIGNHESFPTDQFDHLTKSTQWLLDGLSSAYSGIVDAQSTAQIKQRGFYSRSIPERNLKMISLFGAPYDSINFYNLMKTFDPLNQLEWLKRELQKSEDNDEDVMIIMHIPVSGDYSIDVWTDAFNALVDRYQNTITALFSGHTHDDHVKFHASHQSPDKIIAVDFIGPSLTTFSDHLPSFRVFTVDSETNQVIDYTQYRLNLDFWNKQAPSEKAQWDVAYKWSELYGYPNASMKNIQDWRDKLASGDKQFMLNFWKNKTAPNKPVTEVTDEMIAYAKCDIIGDARENLKCLKEAGISPDVANEIGNFMDFYLTIN